MNDPLNHWQERNEQYLSAALHWLRLRLARLVESLDSGVDASKNDGMSGSEISRSAETLLCAEAEEQPPALVILSRRFGLSRFELEVLLLCAAMELDTRIPALCAKAQDQPNRCYPTFALAFALFDEPAWDAISPERPLRYWRLIEINPLAAQSLITSPLRADERIVNYLKGLNTLDDRLTPNLAPFDVPADETELPPSQRKVITSVVQHLQTAMSAGPPPVTQLVGTENIKKAPFYS